MTMPQFAQTLRLLAESSDPMNLFYNGLLAQQIVEDIQEFAQQWNSSCKLMTMLTFIY